MVDWIGKWRSSQDLDAARPVTGAPYGEPKTWRAYSYCNLTDLNAVTAGLDPVPAFESTTALRN